MNELDAAGELLWRSAGRVDLIATATGFEPEEIVHAACRWIDQHDQLEASGLDEGQRHDAVRRALEIVIENQRGDER